MIYGMKTLAGTVSRVTRPLMTPQKALWAGLYLSWSKIGGRVAEVSRPLRLRWTQGGGTLWLGVWGGNAFLISHESARLMEAVNCYAGYKAVVRIRYKEVLPPQKVQSSTKTTARSSAAQDWAESIVTTKNPKNECLERALLSLGCHLYEEGS